MHNTYTYVRMLEDDCALHSIEKGNANELSLSLH